MSNWVLVSKIVIKYWLISAKPKAIIYYYYCEQEGRAATHGPYRSNLYRPSRSPGSTSTRTWTYNKNRNITNYGLGVGPCNQIWPPGYWLYLLTYLAEGHMPWHYNTQCHVVLPMNYTELTCQYNIRLCPTRSKAPFSLFTNLDISSICHDTYFELSW
jgi:hypothetical protein